MANQTDRLCMLYAHVLLRKRSVAGKNTAALENPPYFCKKNVQEISDKIDSKLGKERRRIMNRKEILEIRKQFSYVDHEKNKVMQTKDAFLALPEEEAFKYFDIFKKALSGGFGKNLIPLDYTQDAEAAGSPHSFLMDLRASKLEDDNLLEEFYDKIIENYNYNENYYIILIHGMYDIPGRGSDGQEMEDASEEVYQHIMGVICPVSLSKPGLSYDAEDNRMQDRIREWVVDKPAKAFLFPAFSDRSTDIHKVLYYTKKSSELQPELIEQVLGAQIPMSADLQKEAFSAVVTDTLAEKCDFETVRNIYENLNDIMEEHAEDPEPLKLDKNDVKKVFEASGVPAEKMDDYELAYKENAGERTEFLAGNITENRKFSVSTPDAEIKIKPDRLDIMRTEVIDGRPCLVIELNGTVSVNGIDVRAVSAE